MSIDISATNGFPWAFILNPDVSLSRLNCWRTSVPDNETLGFRNFFTQSTVILFKKKNKNVSAQKRQTR